MVCGRCEERVLNELVEDGWRHRTGLWRDRLLDTLEHGRMTDEEMRCSLIEGSERVAWKRDHAF